MLMLALTSAQEWPFGILVGEPVCFGFLLLALVLISTPEASPRTAIQAGFVFGLGFMTKQIAAFAALGVICAWFICAWFVAERNAPAKLRYIIIGGALPVLAFEAFKLLTLGWHEYPLLWQRTVETIAVMGSDDSHVFKSRVEIFSGAIATSYAPLPVVTIALLLAIGALLFYRKEQRQTLVWRASLFALVGFVFHMAYVLFVSVLYTRYFWIGVAMGCCSVAAAIMLASSVSRILCVIVSIAVVFVFQLHQTALAQRNWALADVSTRERAEAVRVVDSFPGLPVASENWNSFDDVLYLTQGERRSAYEPSIEALTGLEFLSVVNTRFSDISSVFVRTVMGRCENLSAAAQLIRVYRCPTAFWEAYETSTTQSH